MPLRAFIRYFANNEQLIQKLADSYPFRRAAQITAYALHRGQAIGEDSLQKLKESDALEQLKREVAKPGARIGSFTERFQKAVKEGMENANQKKR